MLLVDATSEATLTSDLANIGRVKNVGKTYQDTLRWLGSQRENWLLIFDNADDITLDLQTYFPPGNHGNIIITTRNQDICMHTDREATCDVSQLNHEDAAALFIRVGQLTFDNISIKTTVSAFVEVGILLILQVETVSLSYEMS